MKAEISFLKSMLEEEKSQAAAARIDLNRAKIKIREMEAEAAVSEKLLSDTRLMLDIQTKRNKDERCCSDATKLRKEIDRSETQATKTRQKLEQKVGNLEILADQVPGLRSEIITFSLHARKSRRQQAKKEMLRNNEIFVI